MSRVLGIDYGERRLGLAVSDEEETLAFPLRVVHVRGERHAIAQVAEARREVNAGKIVVGLPLNMDGSRGPMADRVQGFVGKLSRHVGAPVDTWDERLSSASAERPLREAAMSGRKRRKVRDKLAAQIILQAYLDSRRAGK